MSFLKSIVLIAAFLAFVSVSFGQTFKLDTFSKLDDGELKQRVYSFLGHLVYNQEATGYIIVYGSADELPPEADSSELLYRIRHVIARSTYDKERVTIMYGGLRKTDAADLFVVPAGAPLPEPTWTVARSGGSKKPLLWATDRFHEEDGVLEEFVNRALLRRLENNEETTPEQTDVYDGPAYAVPDDSVPMTPEFDGREQIKSPPDEAIAELIRPQEIQPTVIESPVELSAEDLDEIRFSWVERDFAEAVVKRDCSRGVMIFYADDQFYDIARLENFIGQGRDRLAAKAGIDTYLIDVVFGGFRGQAAVEYNIVPEGGQQPEPKPDDR